MNALLATLLLAFLGGAVAMLGGSRAAAELFRGYREHFVRTIGPGLRQSQVMADLTLLFALSLALIALLGGAGYLLFGLAGVPIGVILGALVPRFVLARIRRRRIERFVTQLPDALHALSASLRSGANFPRGLEQLASWQPAPLSEEFAIVLNEHQIGRDLGESLDNLHRRITRPEIELMTGAINISRQVGGNLADTLESLAETLSEKITIEGKIRALTSMGRLQGWVVTGVPIFMGGAMYLTNPEQMRPLFTEPGGWVTLAIIAVMMTLAAYSIRKIVDIDV